MAIAIRRLDLEEIPENLREGAQEVSKILQGKWNGREIQKMEIADGKLQLIIAEEGNGVSLPASVLIDFPIGERLADRITSINKKLNRIEQVANYCLAGVVISYAAHKILRMTTGIPFFVDIIFSVTEFGYPLSDSVYGYKSVEELRKFEEVADFEGRNIARAKIGESTFSFISGILFSTSEIATILNANFLAGILSFAMLPLYTLAFGISTAVKSYNIFKSVKFKEELDKEMSQETSEKEKLQRGLEHIKELMSPSNEKIRQMLEELKQADLSDDGKQKIIDEKFKEYETEKIKKLNRLERQIGVEKMNELVHQLNNAINDLENGNLESAKILLDKIQQGANQQIKEALIAIILSLIILAVFIVMTILTHGAVLGLIV